MNICRIIICWAVLALPVLLFSSCEEDHDDYDHNIKWGYTICNLIADSSAAGLVTLTYNEDDQITSYTTPGLSKTFTYQSDSVIVNTVTDSFSLSEVIYGGYRDWQKSIATYRAPDKNIAGAILKKVTTTIPTLLDNGNSRITSTTTSSFILNENKTDLGTSTELSTLSYNINDCITKIVTVTNSDTSVYNFTYGAGGIIPNSLFFQTYLSDVLNKATTPFFLKQINNFSSGLLKIEGPNGSLSFSNYKEDGNSNPISYSVVGTGNMTTKTGHVKSTFSCREK